ncbi:MAG: protein translocase subunit SecF [Gammaproteobacteria bacterium]|uniref:Protein-export membrane protein SecF n=1 Tax=OM182 bacterium MED-G24 TaxID=1986255 RepID=A0A2A5WS86_9GAMM|nr:protein translocase subunit SecF [Gammaproteobacteria bacterium]PDH39405.1 MAG: protein translocase subunit SecF [OM182 bacterium MED-G24]RPG24425.1 MAG: protein translocase subunit SecF [Gammaproteobacteria bacterium TMED50]|tara:strand:+ start:2276 stop:3214 length:939 start_codon:yes stop_codon:yes gene_type:complete
MPEFNINFMGYRKIAGGISIALVIGSIAMLAITQVEWGLDFTGGSLVEVAYEVAVSPETVRRELEDAGYDGHVVQYFGSDRDILIRMPPQEQLSQQENASIGDSIIASLRDTTTVNVELRRSEFVGPAVGEELTNEGGLGMLTALGVVMIYIAFRFQLKFAVGAVVALFHDVIVVLGIFAVTRWEFDLTVLAALLAVIGYSLNDTIVVSDRIRENFRKVRRGAPPDIINTSLNQMLGRTLVTSLTTLLVLFALLILGGELIRNFAVALIIGIIVGTYSSIYIAANVLLVLNISKEDLALPVKEGADEPDLMQ